MLYLIVPCVILNAFQVDYTPETVQGLLITFAASLLTQVVLLLAVSALGRVFHLNEVETTSAYYSNSGNLIVPIVTAILGDVWVLYSCVYMSVQLVFFWTHCKKVISREASYDWKKIVLNLNIISIFVGILLFSRHPAACAGQQYASFCRKHGWPCQYDCYGYAFCRHGLPADFCE